jgi:phytoene desaturase
MSKKAVVIGGGIAGLATAALLGKSGMDVELFESRNSLGGRAYLWKKDGFRFDMGPSWYLMPDAFEQYFKLMGTSASEQLKLVRLDPSYQTRNEGLGDKISMPKDLAGIREKFDEIEPGSGKSLDRYLASAKEAYELSMSHFLYTNFRDLRSFLHPAVLKRLGRFLQLLTSSLYDFSGKYVKDERLKKMLIFPAVFLGASPYDTPSMYHLMTHVDMNQGVFYPQGGFHAVIEAIAKLARANGVRIHTSSPVKKIIVKNGKAAGVELATGAVVADLVVGTADLEHVETSLLDTEHQTYPKKWWDRKVPGPSALLMYLGVKGRIAELDHHTLLYTEDWRANFSEVFHKADGKRQVPSPASLYICMPSKTDSSVAPEGFENIFVLVPTAADPSIGKGGINRAGDERLERAADAVIGQISRWCHIPDLAERIVLRRTVGPMDFVQEFNAWNGTALGMAHTLMQSAFFRPKNRSKKVANLFYAGHNTLPGIGLPMCLISAELVYKHLTNDKSSGPIAGELQSRENWAGLK